jgi:catechol 2,3-dioxygenase-like lactoylglutathione lyase family enzyme
MKIGHIELFVEDPLASKEFYESVLRFEVVAVQGSDFVWVRSGGLEIPLRKENPSASPSYESSNQAIVLYTDDLETTERELSRRGLQCQRMSDSDNCPTFTDLDGHWYQLVNPNNV